MSLYAFILGRKNQLSVAELCAVIGDSGTIIDISSEALIAAFDEPLANPQESLNRLGGTIKIAEVFNEDITTKEGIATATASYLIGMWQTKSGKLAYGLSIYSFAERDDTILRKTLNLVKKSLVAAEIKSRFANNNFKNLESAAIVGENLLKKGAEIVAIKGTKKIFVGRTVALQDFEAYGHRDFSRPERDPKMGMLPPKLAQIMINLGGYTKLDGTADAREKENAAKTLFDPFCGIGTVPMEGILLGYNVIGSDIDGIAVNKTGTNIDWIRKQNYNLTSTNEKPAQPETTTPAATPAPTARFFMKDATTLTKSDLPEDINLVVTESYLGPPVSRMPLPENMHRTFLSISETIARFFRALNPLLKKGTPVIICLPFYRDRLRYSFIERIVERISDTGFTARAPFPEEIISKFNLRPQTRPSLMYDRPDQIVGREIFVFTRN